MSSLHQALSGNSSSPDSQSSAPAAPPTGGPAAGSKYAGMPAYEQWRVANPHVPGVVADLAFENSQSTPSAPSMPMTQALQPQQVDPYQNLANKATGQEYQ